MVAIIRVKVDPSWILKGVKMKEAFIFLIEARVILKEVVHDGKLSLASILQQ